jgi:hypothetical protein
MPKLMIDPIEKQLTDAIAKNQEQIAALQVVNNRLKGQLKRRQAEKEKAKADKLSALLVGAGVDEETLQAFLVSRQPRETPSPNEVPYGP